MKALILAAGKGSRLGVITRENPKCLTKVNGREILDYQLDAFMKNGINEIFIVIGYKMNLIKDWCKLKNYSNIEFIENSEFEDTNNMYSLNLAEHTLSGNDFIFCNGDVVFEPSIISKLLKEKNENSIVIQSNEYNEESMKVKIDRQLAVCDISKSISKEDCNGISIDLYKISGECSFLLFNEINKRISTSKKDWTEVALQSLVMERKLTFFPCDIKNLKWYEIDNMQDLLMASKLFSKIDIPLKKAIFLDLDGTVYLNNKLVKGALSFFKQLENKGINYYFLTNNSSKTKLEYLKKIKKFGISATLENFIISTDAVINYLVANNFYEVYVVGTRAVCDVFKKYKINPKSKKPQLVIITFDTELNYSKIKKASIYIQNGVDYILTHKDLVCPTIYGNIPDAGSIGKLIETATGKKEKLIFGKPDPLMITHILKRENLKSEDILIVGDRLSTDLAMAIAVKCDFILTLSGDTKIEEINRIDYQKCLIVNNLDDLNDARA